MREQAVADSPVEKKRKPLQGLSKADILADYKLACVSREASILGRKEVFMGKAKFGIFGDGKELAQLAMARVFRDGDFRSGYYRDQTFMFAIGRLTVQEYFAQLYAHANVEADPASGGRLMNGHFATRMLDDAGNFLDLVNQKNSSSDISPTGGQMPRLLGLAYASKLYRNLDIPNSGKFSRKGNEIAFGTIGNASTSEGLFYEAMNAAGVLQVPMLMSVWDDKFGISVGEEYHTTKRSISEALAGLQRTKQKTGFEVFQVTGWNYPELLDTYFKAESVCRKEHVPCLVHVVEMTQPQGHSTSGSHERYKSKDRLAWETEFDCIRQMRLWLLNEELAKEAELTEMESEAKQEVQEARLAAWNAFRAEIEEEKTEAVSVLAKGGFTQEAEELSQTQNSGRTEIMRAMRRVAFRNSDKEVQAYIERLSAKNYERFNSLLFSRNWEKALTISEPAQYSSESPTVDGREILVACFEEAFSRIPELFAMGEDVGKIGDVNQGMAGLQAKFGELRVTDTGIREATIVGQGIGAALRGLRPIAEIQYLDYLLFAIQTLSDDLATLSYRTAGGQKAPLIVRTRGHRLEGMWHSGSPMGMIINSLRGMHVLVPRNMTQAAGFYNTCFELGDPALIIEPLNGYRLKERLPENIGSMKLPLGVPEVIREGSDVTIVTYGSMCRIVGDGAQFLSESFGIEVEIVDVCSLLPFDVNHLIKGSLRKTNRVIFADEDVPGGASAFMMKQVLEDQEGYFLLDSQPRTITAKEHRPAYGSDGDYYSKPNAEDIIESVLDLMKEAQPARFA